MKYLETRSLDRIDKKLRDWHLEKVVTKDFVGLVHAPTGTRIKSGWNATTADITRRAKQGTVEVNFEDLLLNMIWRQVVRLEPELELLDVGPDRS